MKTFWQIFNKYQTQILYLFFGVMTTVINILIYGGLHLVHTPYQIAYWTAWFVTVLFAYLTNRRWVFSSQARGFKQISVEVFNFYLARFITGILGSGIMIIGVSWLHQNDFIWNIIQNVFVIISNYILSKWFIFKNKEKLKYDD
ncbi:GtrA family protein [Weissella coleopterorum]|uniref:GtrA family protein n=1 Tax=Weissella coleopterorum TaxID=2714949 RepID=A0A6G8B208_9LACO|nr:GtrA family protein [Weissella coleopterorum]QIL51296.1 GtrA family protein [Weissella coleopterorum]